MTYIVVPAQGGGSSIASIRDIAPITDGSNAAAGQIGEILAASQVALTSAGIGATNTWGSAISLALDAGVWEIQGVMEAAEDTAVLSNVISAGVSDSAVGATLGTHEYASVAPFLSGASIFILTPIIRVSINALTTYYLNTRFVYGSGAPQHAGSIWALRYS